MAITYRIYLYTAWHLSSSFVPRQVTLTRQSSYRDFAHSATGPLLPFSELHDSREKAIAFGRQLLAERRKKLEKTIKNIAKHEAALNKAEAA